MEYNPRDVRAWEGVMFNTQSDCGAYLIHNGEIWGRASVNGAEVSDVAGITIEEAEELRVALTSCSIIGGSSMKQVFDDFVSRYARKPEPGLRLAVCLTEKSARQTKRAGLLTSVISGFAKAG